MIIETIKNYVSINNSIDLIIKKSGYKVSYIYEQMGMDNNSFYMKRKHGKFTAKELMKLFTIIDIEKLEDKVLGEMSLDAEKEEGSVRWEEARKAV